MSVSWNCLFAVHSCLKPPNHWGYKGDVSVFTSHEALLSSPLGLLLLLGAGRVTQAVLNLILAVQSTPVQTILHVHIIQ